MDYCIRIENPYSNLRQIANLPQLRGLPKGCHHPKSVIRSASLLILCFSSLFEPSQLFFSGILTTFLSCRSFVLRYRNHPLDAFFTPSPAMRPTHLEEILIWHKPSWPIWVKNSPCHFFFVFLQPIWSPQRCQKGTPWKSATVPLL